MRKSIKTNAYSEGYTAGLSGDGLGTNPYDESTDHDHWNDWKTGYSDGLSDKRLNEDSEEEENYDDMDEW
jgi:ribosome modulation factor